MEIAIFPSIYYYSLVLIIQNRACYLAVHDNIMFGIDNRASNKSVRPQATRVLRHVIILFTSLHVFTE